MSNSSHSFESNSSIIGEEYQPIVSLWEHTNAVSQADSDSYPTATFRPSLTGRSMLVWEATPTLVPRGLMVAIICLQGAAVMIWMLYSWWRRQVRSRLNTSDSNRNGSSTSASFSSVPALSVLNVLVHTAHYADNVWGPADYCEPEWLYRAYLFTEMEITFAFFLPLMVMAVMVSRWDDIIQSQVQLPLSPPRARSLQSSVRQLFLWSCCYLGASFLSGLHYVVEPPHSYAWRANVTITGSCIAAAALCAEVLRIKRVVDTAAGGPGAVASRGTYSTINTSA